MISRLKLLHERVLCLFSQNIQPLQTPNRTHIIRIDLGESYIHITNMPAEQAAGEDPSGCNSTSRKKLPLQ